MLNLPKLYKLETGKDICHSVYGSTEYTDGYVDWLEDKVKLYFDKYSDNTNDFIKGR